MMQAESAKQDAKIMYALWLGLASLLVVLLIGVVFWQRATNWPAWQKSSITHSLVMQQIQNVAKLVSSEATMRDVVIFEDTWLGSTKRSLVVVTAKVLAGINLEQGSDVKIDEAAKKIRITLPRAALLATDITEMKTYNEQSGFWNPFVPKDRDKIYQQARMQFQQAAQEARLTERANQSAKQMLETMFSRDGFTSEVILR